MRTRLLVLFFAFTLVSVNTLPRATRSDDPLTSSTSTDGGDKVADISDGNNKNTIDNNNNNSNGNETVADTAVATSNADVQVGAANATQSAADNKDVVESSSGFGNGDEKLPEGMSESLADFVLNILKGQLSNATKPVPETPPAQSVSAQPALPSGASSETVPDNSTTSGKTGDVSAEDQSWMKEITQTTTSPDTSSEDEDGWSSTENFPSSSSSSSSSLSTTNEPFSKNGKANCDVTVDLNNYCIIGDLVLAYFHEDLTSNGLREPLFDMNIVRRLMSCPRGEWCLGDELEVFENMQKRFYDGPLCHESMWECIFDIMVQREDCSDKEFLFIVDAVDFMCELFQDPPVEGNEKLCFAHALAALHVTYADFLANNMTDVTPSKTDGLCEGYSFRMTKTYLCADGFCDILFDSRLAMEKFGRWSWFMDGVDDVVTKCDLNDTCGALADQTAAQTTWFGMTSPSTWPETISDVFYTEFPDNDQANLDKDNRMTEEDESLMVALSVATAVGLLFMVLGLVFWRRNRRRNLYYYRTEGYGKVPADEAHLLSRSSD